MIESSLGAAVLAGTALLGIVFACVTAILAKLSSDEVTGWLPVWSSRFLKSAVSILPEDHRARYTQEWLAELAAFNQRRVAGLLFAWRLRRRAHSVHDALSEAEGLNGALESESPPTEVKPLDPEAVAAIVRRAVDKTRWRDGQAEKELIAFLMDSLEGLEIGDRPAEITRRYLDELLGSRRTHERSTRTFRGQWGDSDLPSRLPRRSSLDIEGDAKRRLHASEIRRRTRRRRRFGYWR